MKIQCDIQLNSGCRCKSTARHVCRQCGKNICRAHYGVGYKCCDVCTRKNREVSGDLAAPTLKARAS